MKHALGRVFTPGLQFDAVEDEFSAGCLSLSAAP